jgi:hypothetical protein
VSAARRPHPSGRVAPAAPTGSRVPPRGTCLAAPTGTRVPGRGRGQLRRPTCPPAHGSLAADALAWRRWPRQAGVPVSPMHCGSSADTSGPAAGRAGRWHARPAGRDQQSRHIDHTVRLAGWLPQRGYRPRVWLPQAGSAQPHANPAAQPLEPTQVIFGQTWASRNSKQDLACT